MSSRTTNIGLEKVTSDQTIGDLQESMNGSGGNMDIIDTKMGPVGNTSLQAQVDALNSKLTTKAKGVYQSWGTTLTSDAFHIGILIVNHNAAYIVWFAGTTDIDIRSLRVSDGAKSATGSITFGEDNVNGTGYTITRNNANITVEASANATIALIYI